LANLSSTFNKEGNGVDKSARGFAICSWRSTMKTINVDACVEQQFLAVLSCISNEWEFMI